MNGQEKKDAIAARLEALMGKHGRLTPSAVVEDARSPDSPLHDEFTWDDAAAAAAHRLDQARRLIRSVRVVVIEETRVLDAVAYVRDPEAAEGDQGYTSLVLSRDSEAHAVAILKMELARVRASARRLREVASVLGMEDRVAALEVWVAEVRAS